MTFAVAARGSVDLGEAIPLWFRVPAALVAVALAWWAFGRPGGTTGRPARPAAVVAVAFAAAWFALSREGIEYFDQRDEIRWWPLSLAGVACTWPAARGRWLGRSFSTGTRRLLGAAGLLAVAAPFFAFAERVLRGGERLAAVGYGVSHPAAGALGDGLAELPRAAAVGLTCGLFAAAALSQREVEEDRSAEGGP